jgi:hypothetical protein
MVEVILNPKNKPQKAIELEKMACSPLPSVPRIRAKNIDEINEMAIVRT